MISRKLVQKVLGLIWFLDGIFQLKPQMFTSAFIKQVILPTGQGQPHWITVLVNAGAGLATTHIALWNSIFAVVQILLGLALMLNFKVKTTIVLSIVWSAIVWIFGEGFGQLLTGQALLLSGAPGAALIYGLVGGALWPAKEGESFWNQRGIRFAQLALATLFVLGCILQFQGAYLTPGGLSQAVAISWIATLIAHQGTVLSIILGLVELAVAFLFVGRIRLRWAVWSSMVLGLLFWWIGQSFGQIFDPLATDFNSGILLTVLALCAGPEELLTSTQKLHVRRRAVFH